MQDKEKYLQKINMQIRNYRSNSYKQSYQSILKSQLGQLNDLKLKPLNIMVKDAIQKNPPIYKSFLPQINQYDQFRLHSQR